MTVIKMKEKILLQIKLLGEKQFMNILLILNGKSEDDLSFVVNNCTKKCRPKLF